MHFDALYYEKWYPIIKLDIVLNVNSKLNSLMQKLSYVVMIHFVYFDLVHI